MNRKQIPKEDLPSFIGKGVHLKWAAKGAIWILISIEGDKVNLKTPKTSKKLVADVSDVCYTNKHRP